MEVKMVIQVLLSTPVVRTKALKLAAGMPGIKSITLGDGQNDLVIIGNSLDVEILLKRLREGKYRFFRGLNKVFRCCGCSPFCLGIGTVKLKSYTPVEEKKDDKKKDENKDEKGDKPIEIWSRLPPMWHVCEIPGGYPTYPSWSLF